MPRLRTLLQLFFFLMMSVTGTQAFAQTTGVIKGVVVDEADIPVPGVLVTISSESLIGGAQQRETDGDGRFYFPELTPGKYVVKAEKPGFSKVTKPGVVVNMGRTANVSIEIPLDEAGMELVVEEERQVVDTETAGRSSVLNKDFLSNIPTGNSYQQAVELAAGVTGSGNVNIGGGGSNENEYSLDGINITDPVTGTFSANFNFNAIEQLEVITDPFDPEWSTIGGVISIRTEDGGNMLESIAEFRYTNANWSPKLDARYGTDGLQLSPTDFDSYYTSTRLDALISGPIVRDRAWFVFGFTKVRSLISVSGIDLPRDFDGQYMFSKLSWQPNTSHRFRLQMQSDPSSIDNTNQGDLFVRPEAQSRQAQGGYIVAGTWDWFINATMFSQARVSAQKSWIEAGQVPCTHNEDLGYNPCEYDEFENTVDLDTSARLGLNQAYDSGNVVNFQYDDRLRLQAQERFDLLQIDFLGTHDIRFGADFDRMTWDWVTGITGNLYYVDINLLSYDPDSLENYYWVEYTAPRYTYAVSDEVSAFLRDKYKPVDNLTFVYGLRVDRFSIYDDVGNTRLRNTMLQPRVSATWDPWSTQKTKFWARYGRFTDTVRQGLVSQLFNAGFGSKLVLGEAFGNFTTDTDANYFYTPNVNTNYVAESIRSPYADAFSVGGERELFRDIAGGVNFTARYSRNLYAFDEDNYLYDDDGYGSIGTTDGTSVNYYRLRTPSQGRRDYYRADAYLDRDLLDRWQMRFNYSYASSRGAIQVQPGYLTNPAQIPFYLNGYLWTDIRHDVTAAFAWEIPTDPWTTTLSGSISAETGRPQSRFYPDGFGNGFNLLKDTSGSYAREEGFLDFRARVNQAIPVRRGELGVFAEFQNVLNLHQGSFAYITLDNRWVVSGRQDPLGITLGARYEF